MDDVIAVLVDDKSRGKIAFLTWGRVFNRDETRLIKALRTGLRKFGVADDSKVTICGSLREVSSMEYFYEALLKFAWNPIPFGESTYSNWARKTRSAIAKGDEIYLLGPQSGD